MVYGSNWKVELEAREMAELEPSSEGDAGEDLPGVAPKAAARRGVSSPPASCLELKYWVS